MPVQGGCDEPARANFRTDGCESRRVSGPPDQPRDGWADCAGSGITAIDSFSRIQQQAPLLRDESLLSRVVERFLFPRRDTR